MKNKNLLYCFTMTTTSVKAKRPVYQEKGPDKQPETSRPPENDIDKNKEAYRKETMRSARWMVKHLKEKDASYLFDNERQIVKDDIASLEEAIKMVEDTERSPSAPREADKLEDVYKLLRAELEEARSNVLQLDEEVEKEENSNSNEKIKLLGRAGRKLMDAVNHFESEAVKEKNIDSLKKVTNDYMEDWWNNELNDHEREILCWLAEDIKSLQRELRANPRPIRVYAEDRAYFVSVRFPYEGVQKEGMYLDFSEAK
ncbi:hypothetical protein KKH03_01405 [Patescibacteria group bacterium]|nr:hypothetical protein [Patescibacteria group bacterium]